MRVEWINPFITATNSVFKTMLGCEIQRGKPSPKDGMQPEYEVTGIIGLTGSASGTVIVSLSRETAIAATDKMMGQRPTTIDEDVVDVVGEITNMVAGAAKAEMEELEMRVGLPTVIVGKNRIISFPSGANIISIPFDSLWGPLCVDVGLRQD
jgi:chemotaxis protein CheX